MKKIFASFMIVAILASALIFNVGKAGAASYPTLVDSRYVEGKGISFIFDSNGMKVRGPNLKNAVLYVNGDSYPLACTFNKEQESIVCVVRGGLTEFAGMPGTVQLMGYFYSVIIPGRGSSNQTSCTDGQASGAWVQFFTSSESIIEIFVPGNTLVEVRVNANEMLGGYLISIESIGGLVCGPILT